MEIISLHSLKPKQNELYFSGAALRLSLINPKLSDNVFTNKSSFESYVHGASRVSRVPFICMESHL